MDVNNVDLLKLLPSYMREDKFNKALAKALSVQLHKIAEKTELLSIWDHIDDLPEDMLDELAWSLHVDWYDRGAEIEIKKSLIKNADIVHMRLGTPWAVMQVIQDYFGYGEMREWWEYGGTPHYFKVLSSNPNVTGDDVDRFLRVLDVVKRASSWLEGILIVLTGEMPLCVGIATHTYIHETHLISDNVPNSEVTS